MSRKMSQKISTNLLEVVDNIETETTNFCSPTFFI